MLDINTYQFFMSCWNFDDTVVWLSYFLKLWILDLEWNSEVMWVAKNINIFDNICKKLHFVLWDMFSGKILPFGTIFSFISILSSSQVSKLYFVFLFLNFCFYFILLYNTVLVLPYIDMNPPRVYMRSQTWTPLPPPSP